MACLLSSLIFKFQRSHHGSTLHLSANITFFAICRIETRVTSTEREMNASGSGAKSKVNLSLCYLTEHHAMKAYWGVEV
jgi:hypothetical protein